MSIRLGSFLLAALVFLGASPMKAAVIQTSTNFGHSALPFVIDPSSPSTPVTDILGLIIHGFDTSLGTLDQVDFQLSDSLTVSGNTSGISIPFQGSVTAYFLNQPFSFPSSSNPAQISVFHIFSLTDSSQLSLFKTPLISTSVIESISEGGLVIPLDGFSSNGSVQVSYIYTPAAIDPVAVPEPGTLFLLGGGLLSLGIRRRFRREPPAL